MTVLACLALIVAALIVLPLALAHWRRTVVATVWVKP